ncbi:alpha/beta hydrolase [Maioricimonas sp. JC845]|uniref:alpha/beta hydrolase n=1 Tax=Maioricimonas sp. JC845 TaxID=3232138 RepID=UPI00345B22FF
MLVLLLAAVPAAAQESKTKPDRVVLFKTTEQGPLKLHIFEPEGHKATDQRPAIVFFFGGGWVGGSASHFYPQSQYLADRGMVAICAEYRIRSKHKTTPFECVADGKSAMRWVRSHADELGIDPDRLAAGGGSAGGHVAAATATLPGLDDPADDLSVSCVPNALVLFNPVYDNGPDGYGYDRVKERWQEISPLHNIREGIPPAIVFLGTKDRLVPVATGKAFQKKMEDVGSRSELMLWEGAEHGFFNPGKGDGTAYHETVAAMDRFLTELGYLKPAE